MDDFANAMAVSELLRDRLKVARERRNISQPKAAEAIGIEGNTLWRWENGYVKKIPMTGLCGLAGVYNVSVGWLIGQEEALSPEESDLVRMYRTASPGFRRSILAALRAWHDEQTDLRSPSGRRKSPLLEGAG